MGNSENTPDDAAAVVVLVVLLWMPPAIGMFLGGLVQSYHQYKASQQFEKMLRD